MLPRAARCAAAAVAVVIAAACIDKETARRSVFPLMKTGGPRPDELPVMLNPEPPFRYPAELYARRVQGNTTLRIFIDVAGRNPDVDTPADLHTLEGSWP
mgnify:CR=1 FL=1